MMTMGVQRQVSQGGQRVFHMLRLSWLKKFTTMNSNTKAVVVR